MVVILLASAALRAFKRAFLLLLPILLLAHAIPGLANVDLLYFRAESGATVITLVWETETELDNLGFHIWRSQTGNLNDASRINPTLIPSQVGGQPVGAVYEYPDTDVQTGVSYTYWLQSVDVNGNAEYHGPVQAALGGGAPIGTQPPGGGDPEPTRTPLPQTNTPAAGPSSSPLPTNANPQPTAQPAVPSPTVTPATAPADPLGDDGPLVPPPAPGGATAAAGNAYPAPAAVTPAQELSAVGGAAEAPLPLSGDSPVPAAPSAASVTTDPIQNPDQLSAVGSNSPGPAAVGRQTTGDQPGDAAGRRATLGLLALLGGLTLTAGGGFAAWRLLKRAG